MGVFEKILSALGIYEYVEVEEGGAEADEAAAKVQDKTRERPKIAAVPAIEQRYAKRAASTTESSPVRDNVIALPPANRQISVMLVKPRLFDDAQTIADHIKASRPVVVNFESADDQVKKRITDFISGTVYALNGHIKMVGGKTMVCAPSNVDVEELAATGDFNWRK